MSIALAFIAGVFLGIILGIASENREESMLDAVARRAERQ